MRWHWRQSPVGGERAPARWGRERAMKWSCRQGPADRALPCPRPGCERALTRLPGGALPLALAVALGILGLAPSVGAAEPGAAPPAPRPLLVLPVLRSPAEAQQVQALAAELAQRCPGARQDDFAALLALQPTIDPSSAAPPPLGETPRQVFLRAEDSAGGALRLLQLAERLEQDPAALLASPPRRQQLREAYLFAARALLSSDGAEARRLLRQVAQRFPDQPPINAAEWGPAMRAADQEARQELPPRSQRLLLSGPPGYALHIDEQPQGALPRPELTLPPGRHAVVVVAPDGARLSWALTLPAGPAAEVRLAVSREPSALCAVTAGGRQVAGVCPAGGDAAPRGWEGLAFSADSDVLWVASAAGEARVQATRLRLGASPLVARGAGPGAVTSLVQRLCLEPTPARPAPAPRAEGERRLRWPAGLLLGAGVLALAAAAPLWALHGRCVGDACVQIYNFYPLVPSLTGAGAALVLGGGLWLGLSFR